MLSSVPTCGADADAAGGHEPEGGYNYPRKTIKNGPAAGPTVPRQYPHQE
jgi:hypothetical protein